MPASSRELKMVFCGYPTIYFSADVEVSPWAVAEWTNRRLGWVEPGTEACQPSIRAKFWARLWMTGILAGSNELMTCLRRGMSVVEMLCALAKFWTKPDMVISGRL